MRLGLLTPGLFALQVRALSERRASRSWQAKIPGSRSWSRLVGSVMELHLVRDEAERILAMVAAENGVTLSVPIGTMIELPRAALTAHRIADAADFFSFGTNDLTQTTWGFSRDDVESTVFAALPGKGCLHHLAVRDDRCRRRGPAGGDRRARGPKGPSRTSNSASAASTGATRSRSLLPPHRIGLCVVFTVPAAGRPPGSGPGGDHGHGRRRRPESR